MKWVLVILALVLVAGQPPRDFGAPFHGAAALVSGVSPYDQSVTEASQLSYYGRLAEFGEDQHRVAYPVTSLLLLTPLVSLGIENAALLYRVVAAFLLILGVYRLQKSLVWAILAVFLLREPLVAFNLGQMALLGAAFSTLGISLLKERRELPAVLCLVGASISPVLGIPLALLLLWPYRKLWLGYIGIMAALGVISLFAAGWWLPDWISTMRSYPTYTQYGVWMPALIPLGVVALLGSDRFRGATSAVLLSVPLTGLYQTSIAVGLLSRKQLISCGVSLWLLSFIAPLSLRLVLTPLIIVAHLYPLGSLPNLAAQRAAIHAWAGSLAFGRGSASPASAGRALAPSPPVGSGVQVRSTTNGSSRLSSGRS